MTTSAAKAPPSLHLWARPQPVGGTAKDIAESLPETAWRRLSAGDGTKGERLHDWAYLDLADLDASEYNSALTGMWTRGLLIRRNIADGDLAYFSTWWWQFGGKAQDRLRLHAPAKHYLPGFVETGNAAAVLTKVNSQHHDRHGPFLLFVPNTGILADASEEGGPFHKTGPTR